MAVQTDPSALCSRTEDPPVPMRAIETGSWGRSEVLDPGSEVGLGSEMGSGWVELGSGRVGGVEKALYIYHRARVVRVRVGRGGRGYGNRPVLMPFWVPFLDHLWSTSEPPL